MAVNSNMEKILNCYFNSPERRQLGLGTHSRDSVAFASFHCWIRSPWWSLAAGSYNTCRRSLNTRNCGARIITHRGARKKSCWEWCYREASCACVRVTVLSLFARLHMGRCPIIVCGYITIIRPPHPLKNLVK